MKFLIIMLFLIQPNKLFADTRLQVVKECLLNLSNGNQDEARKMALQIKDFKNITNREVAFKGKRCLNKSLEESFGFDPENKRFITGEELARKKALTALLIERQRQETDQETLSRLKLGLKRDQARLLELEMEQARLLDEAIAEFGKTSEERAWDDNKLRVIEASFLACKRLYTDNPSVALVNQLCIQRFIEFGMPER